MNHQVVTKVTGRISDYFVVVGLSEEFTQYPDCHRDSNPKARSSNPLKTRYYGCITDRYPQENRKDYALPDGVPEFCFPNGLDIIDLNSNNIITTMTTATTNATIAKKKIVDPKNKIKPKFHSFVQTSENGSHILGCCLTFYEPMDDRLLSNFKAHMKGLDGDSLTEPTLSDCKLYVPRCICLISHWAFVTSIRAYVCSLYKLTLPPNKLSLPVERYICNFLDDVPSPPAGKVDVTYYLHDTAISFRCPPANEPNVWSGFPLFPLFECLSPENILALLGLVLTERSIIFVSSQLSLLTLCAEAITSLIYPLAWTHCYIPILPMHNIGCLQAPFPFIIGIHKSLLASPDCAIDEASVLVYLDDNKIHYGTQGSSPPMPETRSAKLLEALQEVNVFANRGTSWKTTRLALFDDAFSAVSLSPPKGSGVDERAVRDAFLKFFVSLFKNYRKHLIYGTPSDQKYFDDASYLLEADMEWGDKVRPFLEALTQTQSFSQFVDERVLSVTSNINVIFFDESIDAKMNRYYFKTKTIDTPFLLDQSNRHVKTFVTPTPCKIGLPEDIASYAYETFPSFKREYFSQPQISVNLHMEQSSLAANRLKRSNGSAPSAHLSAISCTYSTYLVALCILTCNSIDKSIHRVAKKKMSFVGTKQIIDDYGGKITTVETRRRTLSRVSWQEGSEGGEKWLPDSLEAMSMGSDGGASDTSDSNMGRGRVDSKHDRESYGAPRLENYRVDLAITIEAAKVALQVAFEALNALGKADDAPDDAVYRALVDVCGSCGLCYETIDLLVHMADEGIQPDKSMLHSVIRAFASDNRVKEAKDKINGQKFQPSDVWTNEDWYRLQKGNGLLYRRFKNAPNKEAASSKGSASNFSIFAEPDSPKKGGAKQPLEAEVSSRDLPSNRWSTLGTDGNVPDLQWSNLVEEETTSTFTATPRLKRQMTVCENMLQREFPGLCVDLCSPKGMGCPHKTCQLGRPLSIGEIYRGWTQGDSNKYTTKCFSCGKEFIPKFSVVCSAPWWVGSAGPGSTLWCEMLSPWTLRKEILNVIYQDGIETLVAKDFRQSTSQRSTVFWNSIISFRLRGLPYSFFLSAEPLHVSFPLKQPDQSPQATRK